MTITSMLPARHVTAAGAAAEENVVSTADAEARQLAMAIARGDEAAFRELYDRYQTRLFRLALVLARGDEPLAHDVVQTVFVTASRKLRRVESEKHLWNWLARVAHQQLAKALQRQRRDNAIISVAELPESDATACDRVLEENLDAALAAMDADDRQIIEWFYFDSLSQKDIAEKTNTTPKAASSRLERARAKLRLALKRRLAHET